VEPSASGTTFTVQVYSTDQEAEYDPHEVKDLLRAMKLLATLGN
jgi:hypothetical protein